MRYSILFISLLLACNNSSNDKSIEKFKDLSNYYRNALKRNLPENGIVVILQNQRCSSCRLATFQRLAKLIETNKFQKTFILSKKDSDLYKTISSLQNSDILIDSSDIRTKYGLDYASDLFFLLKEGHIKKWFEISNENLDHIKLIE